jgi:hypothetical protein
VRRTSFISVVLLAFAVAALAIGGCGGGGGGTTAGSETAAGSDTTSSTPLSKAEFVKLANGICHRERQKLVDEVTTYLREHQGEGKGEEELINTAVATILLPEIQQQIKEIRQLPPPKGDEKTIEEFLSAQEKAADTDPQKFVMNDLDPASTIATAYGLEYCSYSK